MGDRARRASRRSPPSRRPRAFLLDAGLDHLADAEAKVFAPLLDGLLAMPGVRGVGAADDRGPHADGRVHGRRPPSRRGRRRRWRATGIATWAGHSYAVEVVGQLGLAESGGVVRAGVVAYIDDDDVTRLLAEVARLRDRRFPTLR